MERVFYNFHDKVTKTALRHSTPHQRSLLENSILFLAVISFSGLILCHRTFVYRGGAIKSQAMNDKGWNIPSMCFNGVQGLQNDDDVDVTHVMIYDAVGDENESLGNCDVVHQKESFVISVEPLTGLLRTHSSRIIGDAVMTNDENEQGSQQCQQQQQQQQHGSHQNQNLLHEFITNQNITYSFSSTKGYLFLPPHLLYTKNISSQYVIIYSNDVQCFSDDPLLHYVGQTFSGIHDTIMLNWILGYRNGTNGYVRKDGRRDSGSSSSDGEGMIIDLNDYLKEYLFNWPLPSPSSFSSSSSSSDYIITSPPTTTSTLTVKSNSVHHGRWYHNFIIFKIGVLISSLLLFFTTTTLVSFTLHETQDRMLRFTSQLQIHIRRRQPYSILIFTHVIENMVFVPIMIGIIFFLTDCCYNGDKFLAFVILSGVWVCEVFSAISMRTILSCKFYPLVFFAYFTLFHIYYFSCPFGFSYAALVSTVFFQLHAMIFFWNRFELPAIVSGQISFDRPRMTLYDHQLLQQQFVATSNTHAHSSIGGDNGNSDDGSGDSDMTMRHSNNNNSHGSIQRMRSSYPSMSSLGRISSFDGYWVMMDGEIVLQNHQRRMSHERQ